MIVFDLDGTLADERHRRHHLLRRDFAAYHENILSDIPKWPLFSVMRAMQEAGETVQIWSGRHESARLDTLLWLERYAPWHRNRLHPISIKLRPTEDMRSSAVLKEQWLDEALLISRPAVTLAFDDLQSCVDMWRRRGVLCAQVEVNDRDYQA